MYFCGLRGRQTQGPPRAAHTLATPLLFPLTFTTISSYLFESTLQNKQVVFISLKLSRISQVSQFMMVGRGPNWVLSFAE